MLFSCFIHPILIERSHSSAIYTSAYKDIGRFTVQTQLRHFLSIIFLIAMFHLTVQLSVQDAPFIIILIVTMGLTGMTDNYCSEV